jgi:ATP-dependent Lon protease
MKFDVDNFVTYLNKQTSNLFSHEKQKKQLLNDDVINDFKYTALERLEKFGKDILQYKSRDLTKFLSNLKEIFKHIIVSFKTDEQIKKEISDIIRLALIAELSVCINVINNLIIYATNNRMKTLFDCLKYYRLNLDKQKSLKDKGNKGTSGTNKNKRNIDKVNNVSLPKPKKNKKEVKEVKDILDYENNSDYESSDDESKQKLDGDDDDDDDDGDEDDDEDEDEDDEDDEENNAMKELETKESINFIHQIFKNQDEDSETDIIKYFNKLTKNEQKKAMTKIKEINCYNSGDKPTLFQIMEMPINIGQKNNIMKTYTTLTTSRSPEKKLKAWFDALMTIPFGKFKGINLSDINTNKIISFLNNLTTVMDSAIYGHDEAKRQIVQMMGQQIRNPLAKGNMLGIYGPPGNGKTSLVKEGIAKAMDKPFIFISLGGATDSSFLEGHSYTYEGSIYGRILNGLISSHCMDPIIYFDELDKIGKNSKGDEITNILIALTDSSQNSHFRDKYFHGIDIDLSRATMIFSYNDPHNVNPILLDRITTVETKFLMVSQKIHIAQNYLLPNMMKDMGLKNKDVVIDDNTIRYMIDNWTHEGGVRKLKSLLYSIVREVNIANLTNTTIGDTVVTFPFHVSQSNIKQILKYKYEIVSEKIHKEDKCGVINGLYAMSDGSGGGIMPIEILWVPSSKPLEVTATGNLKTVIKESTQVASTLAFNYLTKEMQNKWLVDLKDFPKGLHLHCPEGSTPKEGPSAGTALTCAIYSMLTGRKIKHNIAITGEINLQGRVTAIGGLENKIEGAKKAGVKLILYPKDNEKDVVLIKERNPTLIDDNIKIIAIETIEEAFSHALV